MYWLAERTWAFTWSSGDSRSVARSSLVAPEMKTPVMLLLPYGSRKNRLTLFDQPQIRWLFCQLFRTAVAPIAKGDKIIIKANGRNSANKRVKIVVSAASSGSLSLSWIEFEQFWIQSWFREPFPFRLTKWRWWCSYERISFKQWELVSSQITNPCSRELPGNRGVFVENLIIQSKIPATNNALESFNNIIKQQGTFGKSSADLCPDSFPFWILAFLKDLPKANSAFSE